MSVVFEAGLAGTSVGWRAVQDELSSHAAAQNLSYDRAGVLQAGPALFLCRPCLVAGQVRRELPGQLLIEQNARGW